MSSRPEPESHAAFDREFLRSDADFSVIGGGELGGKAAGLARAREILIEAKLDDAFPGVQVGIPRLAVLGTEVFEQFLAQNQLLELARDEGLTDERIAHAFVQADLPPAVVGDLHALISGVHVPLAVRSSSRLEDALRHPFAGVYATKMIPNNQPDAAERFKRLAEAIKLVWASTYFRDARAYMRMIGQPIEQERMAVVIQEVVGAHINERFYPTISGVIRTHNFYPTGPATAEDGVVNLALGLGKTIVDGGVTWTYCPKYPQHRPPFGSLRDLLRSTQTRFWAVSMAPAPYNPVSEAEHLVEGDLETAEWDDVLRFTASTYDPAADRLMLGTGVAGPRVLTFGRILELDDIPLNDLILRLSAHFRAALDADVEVEFALTLDRQNGLPARLGFLQVRPMLVARDVVSVTDEDLRGPRAIVATERALGNGGVETLVDIVYVRPEAFEARHTPAIAREIEALNRALGAAGRQYVLIGFGRWGSSDPWLGIPSTWPQLSNARVIVEATLPEMNVDASQGSHFFHNMISFGVLYFTVRHSGPFPIRWDWLDRQPAEQETAFLRHIRLPAPVTVRVDGRVGRGVILRSGEDA